MKRAFDLIAALTGLLVLSPLFLLMYLLVVMTSPGGGFFKQVRVGRGGVAFEVFKFRTMYKGSEAKGQLTTGMTESRITGIGSVLRRYKLDELPQLINVVKGDMSIVGPRPEVPRYVEYYNDSQRKVLTVRPGLTSFASLQYVDENRLLEASEDPERTYLKDIMPAKLALDLKYVNERSFRTDIKLIFRTLTRVFT